MDDIRYPAPKSLNTKRTMRHQMEPHCRPVPDRLDNRDFSQRQSPAAFLSWEKADMHAQLVIFGVTRH
ncbi:hypothetical protein THS27_23155 [Thalassospira sp. MCCC 1A01428]|nr:hypothetical protein THS27_23155 [Thalassospira sp. MCCC 1A01428]